MEPLDLPTEIVHRGQYDSAVRHLRAAGALLPTFAQLADPARLPGPVQARIRGVGPDAADAANLFRIHWFNDETRAGRSEAPGFLLLTGELTGVAAPIALVLGNRFPLIGAHKVLAAYACLVARIVSGRFDPARHKAVWPSTGNYCRGGVAIARILGCRSVAVLPEGMSKERFAWLGRWVEHPDDVVRTPGTESNVKEIYDECAALARDDANVILNQFAEFANYAAHVRCTGPALEAVLETLRARNPDLGLAAFAACTGSAGTLGAGDHLKDRHGARIVAVEPVECPTMLYNGYGAHNIQGIGDKHVPLIQNVMNGDAVAAVSDASCDRLDLLFNTDAGRRYLAERRGVDRRTIDGLGNLGLSGIANLLGAIKTARYCGLSANDLIVTVATDDASLYGSERGETLRREFPSGFDTVSAAEVYGEHLRGVGADHYLELDHRDRSRIFNLGYFTWVEQQGLSVEAFDRRRDRRFWRGLRNALPLWDGMIEEFNARTGLDRAD